VKSTILFHARWRPSRGRAHSGGIGLVGLEKKDKNLVGLKKRKNRSKNKSKVPGVGMRRKVAKQERPQSTLGLLEYNSTVAAVLAS
jgi:hypothetical protein